MFGIGGGEPVVHEHSRCQGISGVGIGCEHLIYAFARSFQIVLAWMDTQLGILQQTGIAGRQIIAILPPLMRRDGAKAPDQIRSEEHTSELQSLMRISYAVFCLKKTKTKKQN